jgi:transcriptional regulator with XRE-family HTH domain
MDSHAIGERVRARREGLGLSLRQLARVLGIGDKQRIHRVEMGQDIPASELEDWASALCVSVDWLLGQDGAEEPVPADVARLTSELAALSQPHRDMVRERLSRLPRRPQARCAARPGEGDITRPRSRAA